MYGLEGAWINAAGKRKLDGFHARCIRKIINVAPAFISRVSNAFVLKQVSAYPLSTTLLERQLLYFGRVARLNADSVLRHSLFSHDYALREPALKRGRPRDTWARKVLHSALQITGDTASLQNAIANPAQWREAVHSYCRA